MGTYIRNRIEQRFENPNDINGFRDVKSEKYVDANTDLNFDFELERIEINIKTNQMTIFGWKNYYDKNGNIFKRDRSSYIDMDTMAEYQISEVVDEDTDEVLEILSEEKISDEYTPISKWDSQLGDSISSAILNQFIKRNNLK